MNFCIIYTGGTIGCVGNPLAPMPGSNFEQAFNTLITPMIQAQHADFSVSFISFNPALDSTNLQPSDWCTIANDIVANYNSYDAFIVLHGTDSMAWTASALPFLLTGFNANGQVIAVLDKPVTVTGAQLPLFYQSPSNSQEYSILYNTDALRNVCGAVEAAYAGVREVCLYFDDKLMRGNRTLKSNASQFYAFSSPNYPILGQYGITFTVNPSTLRPFPHQNPGIALSNPDGAALAALSNQLAAISQAIDNNIVIDVPSFPAYYSNSSSVLAQMLNSAAEIPNLVGVVLESYGEGNFPSGNPATPSDGLIYQALNALNEKGIVIVNCTQVISGIVNSSAYASGSWLTDVNALNAYDMSPIAALTKLTCLSAINMGNNYKWSPALLGQLMLSNLAGEIMNVDSLDSRCNGGTLNDIPTGMLSVGQSITSLDGTALLIMNENGPVLYEISQSGGQTTLWQPPCAPDLTPYQLVMQQDANLVVYDRTGQPLWASGASQTGIDAITLIVQGSSSPSGITLQITGTYGGGGSYSYTVYSQNG